MADIDAVIRKCVDDIWAEYDKDNSGELDKEETKKFVQNTLSEMADSGEFSEADFEACFKEFDKDGSGTIEKDEMAVFIKKVAGLWTLPQLLAPMFANAENYPLINFPNHLRKIPASSHWTMSLPLASVDISSHLTVWVRIL